MDILNTYHIYLTITAIVLLVVIFILLIKTNKQLKEVKQKYEKFMLKEDVDLENLLTHYAERVKQNEKEQEILAQAIETIKERMKYNIQKTAMVRYNAYDKTGADLSFVLALLDESNDGAVINGIYGREGCYIYGKPIKNSESEHNLSDEEYEAIRLAKANNKSLN